jgi:hypothetical protein
MWIDKEELEKAIAGRKLYNSFVNMAGLISGSVAFSFGEYARAISLEHVQLMNLGPLFIF